MKTNIAAMLIIVLITSCHKEPSCSQLSNYQNTYVLRDSIIFPHDSIAIVPDTITISLISNGGGKCFVNSFSAQNLFLVAQGCSDNFTLDTVSYGSATYFGNGGISNNGQNIRLYVYQLPSFFLGGDTLQYYCTGTRQ